MIEKGQISKIDLIKKTASVTFKHLDNTVTSNIPLMVLPIEAAPWKIDNVVSNSKITIDYIPNYKVGDWVIVTFFGSNFIDGAILGKIGGD